MTRKELLKEGRAYLRHTGDSREVDAELLLAFVTRIPREHLIAHLEESAASKQAMQYRSLLKQRYSGVPLPYLTGTTEFFSRQFIVTKHTLVPRPESEAIIEQAILWHDSLPVRLKTPAAADIGTGSGILAVTLAKEIPTLRIVASDRSSRALAVARRNARKHRVGKRVSCVQSDLLRNISSIPILLVANLPYVPLDELSRASISSDTRGLQYEPQSALDGGPDGMFVFRRFAQQLKQSQKIRTTLKCMILEHAPDQQKALIELIQHALLPLSPYSATPYVTVWR